MRVLVAIVFLLLGVASSAPTFGESAYRSDRVDSGYDVTSRDYEDGPQVFRGKFNGKCYDDGIYYQDSSSFVLCSHGNSYVMPCSPGTKNDAFGYYEKHIGKNNEDVQLCDVNLVDTGYGNGLSEHDLYAPLNGPAALDVYPTYQPVAPSGGSSSYSSDGYGQGSYGGYRLETEAESPRNGHSRSHGNQRDRARSDGYSAYDQSGSSSASSSYGGYRSRDYQWQQ